MRNKFFVLLIVPIVILSLFSGLVMPARALGVVTPTPTPATPVTVTVSGNDISLFQVDQTEIQLNGPYASSSVAFGLPASWRLTTGAKMQLNLAVSFNAVAQAGVDASALAVQGGTLTVLMNGVSVGVLSLNQIGEVTQAFDIPNEALISQRSDGRMDVSFVLDSGISCYVNQQMTVLIHTSSRFSLPHNEVTPDTSLVYFPLPIYQGSVFPESALVVIPDSPTSAELQAALTIAAGLGNLTSGGLNMDLVSAGKLTAEQQASNHLILVGKAASLSMLKDLSLPLPAAGGQFTFEPGGADNGVVEMVISPWSLAQAVMVVSGNSDAGVIKAAQAVSTGLLRPNASPNFAVVQQVQPDPIKTAVAVDQSLGDLSFAQTGAAPALGKALKTLRFANVSSASYLFYMPPGQTVAPSAYFDLVFGHSALLNYNRSGLVVSINGQPIGSVRMSDATAGQANNHVQFSIPATVILPGYNRLDIKANLIPNDACTNPQLDGLWVTIWPDSNLHLPVTTAQVNTNSAIDLSAYPAPFTFQPTLGDTAFVLPHDDLEAWRSALQVAGFLGNRTKSALFTFSVFYGDEMKDADRAKFNLVLIGRSSQLPIVADMNSSLPAPFDKASDVAIETGMQVTYNIPPSAPAGYLELFPSPWNPANLVLAAMGNSSQGVTWAASALVDPLLRGRLAGNFATISGTQVITADTRHSPYADIIAPVPANPDGTASKLDLTPPAANQPGWILPAIYLASALILLVLVAALIGAWLRSRKSA